MSTLEEKIGTRIRALRNRDETTLAQLSAAAGLSSGMLSKIENGLASPSLTTLLAVAGAFSAPLTSLFAEIDEKRSYSFVPSGYGSAVERSGSKVGHGYKLLGANVDYDVVVEPYLITLSDDAEPYTGFRHSGIELIYMLSGEIIYRHATGRADFRWRP